MNQDAENKISCVCLFMYHTAANVFGVKYVIALNRIRDVDSGSCLLLRTPQEAGLRDELRRRKNEVKRGNAAVICTHYLLSEDGSRFRQLSVLQTFRDGSDLPVRSGKVV